MTWSFVTYRDGAEKRLGTRLEGGTVLALPELKQWPDMLDLLDNWSAASGVLAGMSLAGAPLSGPSRCSPRPAGRARCCARA